MASHDPSKYRFSTPTYVLLFSTLLTAYYMYLFNLLAKVLSVDFELLAAGIPRCLKRVDSKCKPKEFIPSGIHFRNYLGVR